jgi:hypothetical protein
VGADFYVPGSKMSRFAAAYTMLPGGTTLIPVFRPRMDPIMSYGAPAFISLGSGLLSSAKDYSRSVHTHTGSAWLTS